MENTSNPTNTMRPETCDHCKRTIAGAQSCCPFHYHMTEEQARAADMNEEQTRMTRKLRQSGFVTVLFVAMLTGSAHAAAAACSTLYHHGDRDVVLCNIADTYTRTDYIGHSATESTITQAAYTKLVEQDAADLKAHTAQLDAANQKFSADMGKIVAASELRTKALAITSKKSCRAAGFEWVHSVCSVKDGQ